LTGNGASPRGNLVSTFRASTPPLVPLYNSIKHPVDAGPPPRALLTFGYFDVTLRDVVPIERGIAAETTRTLFLSAEQPFCEPSFRGPPVDRATVPAHKRRRESGPKLTDPSESSSVFSENVYSLWHPRATILAEEPFGDQWETIERITVCYTAKYLGNFTVL